MSSLALICVAQSAAATDPVCPPIGLYFEVEEAQQVLRIVPGCLGDPEDIGIALAEITRIVLDTYKEQNPNEAYVSVEEVLVESYVSEILEPSVSVSAN